eukprot:Colp12_sorted_trinity150504_noHs@17265
MLLVGVKSHDFGHNEALLEVRVNLASGLGCLVALADSPGLDLIRAGSEEVLKLEGLETCSHNLGQHGGGTSLLRVRLTLSLAHVKPLSLESTGEGDDEITLVAVINPVLDLGKPLVLLADVVRLRKVNKVDDRLGSDEKELVENLDLLSIPCTHANVLVLLRQPLVELLSHFKLSLESLITGAAALTGHRVDLVLSELNILKKELVVDDLKIADGINTTLDVGDILLLESTANMENTIDALNVRQESVTKTLTLRGTLHKTGNISDVEESGDIVGRLVVSNEPVEALIRDSATGLVGINCAEGEVLSSSRALGKHVEESGLADVRKTNNTHSKLGAEATQNGLLFNNGLLGRHFGFPKTLPLRYRSEISPCTLR